MNRSKYFHRSISILALTLFCISTVIAQSVVAHIPLGRTPTSLAVNPVTNRVYVASKSLLSSSLQVIDGSTNTISTTLSLTFQPEAIAVNPTTNRIYSVDFIRGLFVLDGTTNTVVANVALPLVSAKHSRQSRDQLRIRC